jgi:hypothetical protein
MTKNENQYEHNLGCVTWFGVQWDTKLYFSVSPRGEYFDMLNFLPHKISGPYIEWC